MDSGRREIENEHCFFGIDNVFAGFAEEGRSTGLGRFEYRAESIYPGWDDLLSGWVGRQTGQADRIPGCFDLPGLGRFAVMG